MVERKQRVNQLYQLDIETSEKNPRGNLNDISSILKVESTLKFPPRIDVIISTWIRLSKSMKSRWTFHVEFRRRIDGESTKMCALGNDFYILSIFAKKLHHRWLAWLIDDTAAFHTWEVHAKHQINKKSN